MNCVTAHEHRALELVDIIDFKWLMAHEGHHIHVERLQRDAVYAGACLTLAAASPSEALRMAGRRLACALGIGCSA
jgi:hypothetical protein